MDLLARFKNRAWKRDRNKNDAYLEDLNPIVDKVNEIITTNPALGYYATLADLQTAHPIGVTGQFAVVGNVMYLWDASTSSWIAVGGSTTDVKVYKAFIQQVGTSDPIVHKIIENTFNVDISFQYNSVGGYLINGTNLMVGRTTLRLDLGTGYGRWAHTKQDSNSTYLQTSTATGVLSNGVLNPSCLLTIEQYPW